MSGDLDAQSQGCIALAVVALLFVISAFVAWREFRYFVSGAEATAQIRDARVVVQRRRGLSALLGSSKRLHITYSFAMPDGTTAPGEVYLPADHPMPDEDATLPVVYLPGAPEYNRMVGQGSAIPVLFFMVCLGGLIGLGAYTWKQAGSDVKRARRA